MDLIFCFFLSPIGDFLFFSENGKKKLYLVIYKMGIKFDIKFKI